MQQFTPFLELFFFELVLLTGKVLLSSIIRQNLLIKTHCPLEKLNNWRRVVIKGEYDASAKGAGATQPHRSESRFARLLTLHLHHACFTIHFAPLCSASFMVPFELSSYSPFITTRVLLQTQGYSPSHHSR